DARIDPTFVRRAAHLLSVGHRAATARRRMLAPARRSAFLGWFAQAQDDEQSLDGRLPAARHGLGPGSGVRGDGGLRGRLLLAEAGGWDAWSVCEDLELSSRLYARHGVSVAWSPDWVVFEQPVDSIGALWRQRSRWAEGMVRRELATFAP